MVLERFSSSLTHKKNPFYLHPLFCPLYFSLFWEEIIRIFFTNNAVSYERSLLFSFIYFTSRPSLGN